MDRVDRILYHSQFEEMMKKIDFLERDRLFCKHGMNHLLDVARIAYILNLEEKYGYDAELIYAAALLHDIGKAENPGSGGESHGERSARTAISILKDCGYEPLEISEITDAIKSHGHDNVIKEKSLSQLLQRADHKSRNCFMCEMTRECKWSEERKNGGILW